MRTSNKPSPTPLIVLLIGLGVILFGALFGQPPAPCPIRVIASTEQGIREEMNREQREKQYLRAAATARAIYRKNGCSQTFASLTGRVAVDYGISPRILAALVFVESSCNPNAVSPDGSVGLTQPNMKVWKFAKAQLLDPEFNLKVGASILASFTRRYGLKQGLHAYNGFGNSTAEYSDSVLIAAGLTN